MTNISLAASRKLRKKEIMRLVKEMLNDAIDSDNKKIAMNTHAFLFQATEVASDINRYIVAKKSILH